MPKTRNNLYEGMYILSATLSEDARKKAIEKITSFITHHAGEVHKIFERGRKRLAYEINGKREGFYYVIFFTANSANMTEIWQDYKLNEDLLRFMTLRAEEIPETLDFKSLASE